MLGAIVSSLPQGILWKDTDSVYLGCNDLAAKLLGLATPEAIVGLKDIDLPWNPKQLTAIANMDQRVLDRKKSIKQNFKVTIAGRDEYLDWHTSPIIDKESQQLMGLVINCEDVSDTQGLLEDNANLLSTVLETIGEGIILSDLDGRLVVFNSKMQEITGYSRQEVATSPDFLRLLYPDHADYERAIAMMKRVLEEKTIRDEEMTMMSQYGLQRTVLVSISLLNYLQRTFFLSAYRDVTDSKSTQIAFIQVEQRYRGLLEHAIEGIYQTSPDGRFISVNNALARLYGCDNPREFMTRYADLQRVPYILPARGRELLELLQEVDMISHFESQIERINGEVIWLSENIRIARDQSDRPIYYEGTVEDITQRKLAEIALNQQAEKQRLISLITQKMHSSSDVGEICKIAVYEVREFLQADRVLILKMIDEARISVFSECVTGQWSSIQDSMINNEDLVQEFSLLYRSPGVKVNDDIYDADLSREYLDWLGNLEVKANLVVPIMQEDKLWGLFTVQQCSGPRIWQKVETQLLQQLSSQLAIALKQEQLKQRLQDANQELGKLTTADGLTQIANRRQFDQYLDNEWRRALRDKTELSLILCDIDFFKAYNDQYGQDAGDLCLQQVSVAISKSVKRPADLIARYAGEQFGVILPNTDIAGAYHVAKVMRSLVNDLRLPHPKSRASKYLTVSIGFACLIPQRHSTLLQLVQNADNALHQAKDKGRDRIVAFRDILNR